MCADFSSGLMSLIEAGDVCVLFVWLITESCWETQDFNDIRLQWIWLVVHATFR